MFEVTVYVTLRVNDAKTGELLEIVDGLYTLEDEKEINVGDFADAIRDELIKELDYNYASKDVVFRLDYVRLEDELDEEED